VVYLQKTGGLFTEDGNANIVGGTGAGSSLLSSAYNNFLAGYNAGDSITTGDLNVAIGAYAGTNITLTTHNVAVGAYAMNRPDATTSGGFNVAIGSNAGRAINNLNSIQNTFIGANSGNSTAASGQLVRFNVVAGYAAMSSMYGGDSNVAIGKFAITNLNNADSNIGVGESALRTLVNGNFNVVLGHMSGYWLGGTSSSNICIGPNAGPASAVTLSNKLFINNAASDTPLIGGDFSTADITINGNFTVTGTTTGVALTNLDDVALGSPITDQVLTFNGTNWVNQTPESGITDHTLLSNIGTNTHAQIDTHISDTTIHFSTLDGLSDVVFGSPITDEVLTFNGTNWVNAPLTGEANNNWLTANNNTNFGTSPIATSTESIALGDAATTGANTFAIAIGSAATSSGNGISIGRGSEAATASVGIGFLGEAKGSYSVAIGRSAKTGTTSGRSIAIGNNAYARSNTEQSIVMGYITAAYQSHQVNIGQNLRHAGTTIVNTDVAHSVKLGSGLAADRNVLHLFSKGKLELYGAEAQYIFPNYAVTGSPVEVPANSIEGGVIYDSVAKGLEVYDGTSWSAIGGVTELNDLTDVVLGGSPLLTGHTLTYDGANWINQTPESGITDHTLLSNIGTNTHAQIDTHISDTTVHFTTLDGLSDVALGSPITDQVLTFNGTNWINQTPESGITDHTLLSNIGTNTHAQIDTHISDTTIHFTTLDGLSDVALGSPTTDQVLTFNGTNWINAPLTGEANNNWLTANNGTNFNPAPIATGLASLAIGEGATTAAHVISIAIGDDATASGARAIAIGGGSEANTASVGIGFLGEAKGSYSIAIGRSANTSATNATNGLAIGNNVSVRANTQDSIVIGNVVQSYQATQLNIGWALRHGSVPIVDTDVSYSVKLGYGTAANRNVMHLFSKGKLELYGDEAQFIFPSYAVTGSPIEVPANSVEGGVVYDSVANGLEVYDGTNWSAIGGIASVFDDKSPELGADLNVNDFNIVGKPAATVTSAGGAVNIAAADGGATSGDGGDITLIPGTGSTDGIVAVTGNMEVSGTVKVNAALAISSTNITASYGDALTITSGDGVAVGSTMKIISGAGDIGGNVVIEGGNGSSTTGGAITIKGGYGYNIGGQVRILGGYGYHTTAGVVILTPGHTYAGNDAGKIIIESSLSSNIATEMRFNEGESNGVGYVALKAPDSITTASRTWILPDDDPNTVAGQFLTTSSTGELSFVSGLANPLIADLDTGGFDFIAPDSATVTADSVQITAGTHTGAVAVKSGGTVFLNGGYTNSPGGAGGAIRLIAGNNTHASDTASPGGRVELRAGTSGPSRGGHCEITGGDSTDNTGGDVIITGGYSTNIKGGGVKIEGGYTGYTYTGGDVTISGGRSYSAAGGNVILQGGVSDNATAGTTIQIHRAKDETGQAELQFWDDTNTGHTTGNYVALKAPAFVGSPVANITFVLPELDGAAGDVLQTDGTGNLGFGTAPIRTPIYTLATLPTVVEGAIIYVSDATGNSLTGSQCFGNATVWVDVTTGAAVA